ncbi:MAG TPA: AMP-binding protein [Acidimicrobiales bacterium]|nr:AMP-binding protein [Acidimicrobiales bacterium]
MSSPRRSPTVADLLAARPAGRVAFVEAASGRTLTWGDITATAAGWAARRHVALESYARVGVAVRDPLACLRLVLSALASGVTVAPLDHDASRAELVTKVDVLGLSAVVTDVDDLDGVWPPGVAPVTIWAAHDEPWQWSPAGRPPAASGEAPSEAPGEAALILASSGTTGEPKIVGLGVDRLVAAAANIVGHHQLGPDDRGYCPLPLFHVNALVVGVLANLVSGATLIVDRRFSASHFWDRVIGHRATWLNLVPGIIGVLNQVPAPPPDMGGRIRFARSASAPLAPAAAAVFRSRTGVSVLETYGMTEAAGQITANPLSPHRRRPGSVGLPVGVELRVVDTDGIPLPPGSVGGIEVRGATVVSHYLAPAGLHSAGRRPATTGAGWLPTGDVGRIDDDGFVYLVGRADDVINRGGEKVHPREIEDVLLGDPRVMAAVVVPRGHPTLGEEAVAHVLAGPGGSDPAGLAAALADRCRRQLGQSRRPAEITVVDTLPAGPTGKIRRAEVRRQVSVGGAAR